MMTSEESDSLSTILLDGHPDDATASGTEEAPSSMVSSETESDGSFLSEAPRHDASDVALTSVAESGVDRALSPLDQNLGPQPDVRAVGSSCILGVY